MFGESLLAVKNAEERAAKIVEAARVKAAKIEAEATQEIERINAETQDKVIKLYAKAEAGQKQDDDEGAVAASIEIDEAKAAAAKKYIMAEFRKRYRA